MLPRDVDARPLLLRQVRNVLVLGSGRTSDGELNLCIGPVWDDRPLDEYASYAQAAFGDRALTSTIIDIAGTRGAQIQAWEGGLARRLPREVRITRHSSDIHTVQGRV